MNDGHYHHHREDQQQNRNSNSANRNNYSQSYRSNRAPSGNLVYVRPQLQQSQQQQQSQAKESSNFTIKVTGFSRLNDPLALIKFLKSKTTRTFFATNIHPEANPEALLFQVATRADAMAINQLNGIQYFKERLNIRILDFDPSAQMQTSTAESAALLKEKLISFVEQSLSPDRQIGHFDSAQYKLFSSIGLKVNFNQKQFANVFLDLISELAPSLQALNLANNGIYTLSGFSQMWLRLRNLKCLNLEKNDIEAVKELENIEKLSGLREIFLAGNPISSRFELSKVIGNYLPNLQFLDGKPFESARVLMGNPREYFGSFGNFFDSSNTSQLVEQVFSKYFPLFDQSKMLLEGLYAEFSTFSFSSTHYYPAFQPRTLPKIPGCRTGLFDSSDQFVPFEGQTRKGQDICKFFQLMPQTNHRLESMSFDCWMSGGGSRLNVFVNGEFEDSTGFSRLFTRSFLLVPAVGGGAVSGNSWPVRIVNDILTIIRTKVKQ